MNNELKTVTIGGIEYPLYLNLYAVKAIQKKYGDIDDVKKLVASPSSLNDAMDIAADLVAILAAQGVAYQKYFDKELKLRPPTAEDILTLATPFELMDMRVALFECITGDSAQVVKGEPVEEDPEKNSTDE